MRPELFGRLEQLTGELRALVAKASTKTVSLFCFDTIVLLGPRKTLPKFGLTSPFKQGFHLLGLMLGTAEPAGGDGLDDAGWKTACALLREILDCYALSYFPTKDELPRVGDEEWRKPRDVAMPAFLHYFTAAELASRGQLIWKVTETLVPFDDELEKCLGLSASDALAIADWVVHRVADEMERHVETFRALMAIYERARRVGWSRRRSEREIASDPEIASLRPDPDSSPGSPLGFRYRDLAAEFGEEKARAFWGLFVSRRGGAAEYSFIDDENPAERRPIFEYAEGEAACPVSTALLMALVSQYSEALVRGRLKERFLKRRGRALEEAAEDAFRAFYGDEAEYYPAACETPDLQNEHDLVIVWKRTLLVVESKASPVRGPRREPGRALTRLRDDFRGSIQSAYDQGQRIEGWLRAGKSVALYNEGGVLLRVLESGDLDEVHCLCVTGHDYGALATDLTLLLEKEPDAAFPWAIFLFSLETFLGELKKRGLAPEVFSKFLGERQQLQGVVAGCTDELEVAGAFIKFGTLSGFIEKGGRILMDPEFDDVFYEGMGLDEDRPTAAGGSPGGPVLRDVLRRFGGEYADVLGAQVPVVGRVGRNDRCPCGSGRKFKKCCGRSGSVPW